MNMTPVCPFVKAARPDDNNASKKSGENSMKHQAESESKVKKEVNDSASIFFQSKEIFSVDTKGTKHCGFCYH